ncbi:MAG TPA: glycosyltransferase [Candidatus Latescibacteria bacterium]|nr:glycosyltransferase [Candidatus Latescibacterota bacterium]HOS64363.1 glycosyltransferase [Candidatus Latescibacterota bacterium]HPK75780.1 glycosyltransferase [Candidatus Latescibacterota bacterium]
MTDPLISVIIPTYNGATRGFLAEAIESVLAQTYRNFELIIVDDGSTDGTRALCEGYLFDKRVHVVSQRNKGPAAARNLGIEASNGEFLCFLDDDDRLKPEKLDKQLRHIRACLEKDPLTGVVLHATHVIDDDGQVIGTRYNDAEGDVRERMFFSCGIQGPLSAMVPRAVFAAVGFFEEGKPYGVEDYDMWMRISRSYHFHSNREVLAEYREHDRGNLCKNRRSQELGVLGVLDRAFEFPHRVPSCEVYGHWYRAFSMWHFREGDYRECRRCYVIARHYGPVGWRLRLAYWAAHFPRFVRFLERRFPRFVDRFRRGKRMA